MERFERSLTEVSRLEEVADINQFVIDTRKDVLQLLHLFVEFLAGRIACAEVAQLTLYLIDGSFYFLW